MKAKTNLIMGKECSKCNETKPLSEFHKSSDMADGHRNECICCANRATRLNRINNIERYKERDRVRASSEAYKEYQRQYRALHPKKRKAHNMVNNYIRDGKLTRGDSCQECDSTVSIQGHHADYDNPLDVRWLCAACHQQWHAVNGQALNPK